MHHFDCDDWVLSDIVEPTPVVGPITVKRISEKMVEKRRRLRAETLHVVICVLLKYQGEDVYDIEWKDTLNIAGYPAMGTHTLAGKYTDTVSLRKIMSPSVNLETLFARVSVAMKECKSRPQTVKRLNNRLKVKLSKADTVSWRGDSHLSQYKVPCLFERNDPQIQGFLDV